MNNRFVTDQIAQKTVRVAYCPTDDMTGDFFTKPLQGSKFTGFRGTILNLKGHQNTPTPGYIHVADLRPITGQECVGSTSCDTAITASNAMMNSTGIGPATVKVRTPDDREWHQATRRPNRPNRPNPSRFNKPEIRPIRKL